MFIYMASKDLQTYLLLFPLNQYITSVENLKQA